MELNEKQKAFQEATLQEFMRKVAESDDTTYECFDCGNIGDCRAEGSTFSTFTPYIDPYNPRKGLKMDDIRGIWICRTCNEFRNKTR